MIEDIVALIAGGLWAMISSIAFVYFIWSSEKNRKFLGLIGRFMLWFGAIFSAGSLVILIDEKVWEEFFLTLAENADMARIVGATMVWISGTIAFIYFLRWFRTRIG